MTDYDTLVVLSANDATASAAVASITTAMYALNNSIMLNIDNSLGSDVVVQASVDGQYYKTLLDDVSSTAAEVTGPWRFFRAYTSGTMSGSVQVTLNYWK